MPWVVARIGVTSFYTRYVALCLLCGRLSFGILNPDLGRSVAYNNIELPPTALVVTSQMRLSRTVHFPVHPVTCISRSPTILEYDVMNKYDYHTLHCSRCRRACHGRAFVSPDLCPIGRNCSADVAEYLFGGGNGHVYSTAISHARYLRVEIPLIFVYVRQLLGQIIRRCLLRQYKTPPGILLKQAQRGRRELPLYVLVTRYRKGY